MGNQMSSFKKQLLGIVREFSESEWEPIELLFERNNFKYSFLSESGLHSKKHYMSRRGKNIIQRHSFILQDEKHANTFADVLKWRNSVHVFPDVKYIKFGQSLRPCFCGAIQSIELYTQLVQYRLSQLENLPLGEFIYIIREIFKGYTSIFQKFPQTDFIEDLVCITEDFKVKIWINSDIAKFTPEKMFEQSGFDNQRHLIRKIINAVSNRMREPQAVNHFKSFINLKAYNFQDTIQGINIYAKNNKIIVPDSLEYLKSKNSFISSSQSSSISEGRSPNPEDGLMHDKMASTVDSFSSCSVSSIPKKKSSVDSFPELSGVEQALCMAEKKENRLSGTVIEFRERYKQLKTEYEEGKQRLRHVSFEESNMWNENQGKTYSRNRDQYEFSQNISRDLSFKIEHLLQFMQEMKKDI